MKPKRCVTVSAWLPREAAELLQTIADTERRSRSAVVRNLLLDNLASQVKSPGAKQELIRGEGDEDQA